MTRVNNLNGTADNDSRSKGYPTWKAFWQAKTGRTFGVCSCSGCKASADVGAHVQKDDSADKNGILFRFAAHVTKRAREKFLKSGIMI